MSYHYSKLTGYSFEQAIERVMEELKKEGFGVLTEIDVKDTLKKKIDVEFPKYKILGACNPHFAYKALTIENKIGTMLPCNVVVQEHADRKVEVSVIDPVASMMAIKNEKLSAVAKDIQQKLKNVMANL
jgi:uncharacterized protein (DUF302 family)